MKIDWPKFVGVLDDEQMGSLIFLSFLCESHKAVQKLKPIRDWLIRAIPTMHEFKYESVHNDDIAVDTFARAMKEKMAQAREKGRGGWEGCNSADLSRMLSEHVEKGDPCDVANFCMMLWHRGFAIAPQPAQTAAPASWNAIWPEPGDTGTVSFDAATQPASDQQCPPECDFAQCTQCYDGERQDYVATTPSEVEQVLDRIDSGQQAARGLSTEQIDAIRDSFSGIDGIPSRATVQRIAMQVLAAAKGDGHAD